MPNISRWCIMVRIWRRCPTRRSRSGRDATRAGVGAFIGPSRNSLAVFFELAFAGSGASGSTLAMRTGFVTGFAAASAFLSPAFLSRPRASFRPAFAAFVGARLVDAAALTVCRLASGFAPGFATDCGAALARLGRHLLARRDLEARLTHQLSGRRTVGARAISRSARPPRAARIGAAARAPRLAPPVLRH